MNETWKWIPGYEGYYEASSRGRVRSVDRLIQRPQPRRMRGQILVPYVSTTGYETVALSREGLVAKRAVHLCVAAAFLGPRPEGLDTCHNNGDQLDNRVENLRYDTRRANLLDAVRHLSNQNSAKSHCPKGHPYSGENLRVSSKGWRYCRTCQRRHSREYKKEKRMAAKA